MNIVAKDTPAAETTKYTYTADATDKVCADLKLYRVGTVEMNEKYYHVANLKKENFHKLYTLRAKPGVTNVGTVEEVKDPNDPTSYNILWTVTSAEAIANVDKEITYVAEYIDGAGAVAFEITFKGKLNRPEFNAGALMITNYWFGGGKFVRHNVAVPAVNETDPAKCTFITNINNAFVNKNYQLAIADGVSMNTSLLRIKAR